MVLISNEQLAGVLRTHHSGDVTFNEGISFPSQVWPAEWLEVQYKEYPRLGPTVALNESSVPEMVLGQALALRRSVGQFSGGPVQVDTLSAALNCAVRERQGGHAVSRPYPSAGALYPVETYLLSVNAAPLEGGIYHYRADRHDLTLLFRQDRLGDLVAQIHGQDFGQPAAIFAFTAAIQRNSNKYGARGYRFALLEMGACAFGLDLALVASGLQTRWIGGFADGKMASLLGVSADQELELPTLLLAAG
jgi:SagB-type dehydrogenase family enzyme